MKLSEKQQKIIDYARENGMQITKQKAVELIGNGYFANADKYVGEILSRMVKMRWLIRVKPGLFKIGNGYSTITIKNQTSLL